MGRRRRDGDPALVVGYVRVSTDEQQLSTDAQRDALNAWCDENERALVHVCEDRGVSGAAEIDKRTGLMEAIAALREYRAGVVLVVRVDRLARDVGKAAIIEEMIAREGARVLSCDGVGNETGPEANLLKNLIRSISQYERQIIALRTKVALQAKKTRGLRYNCRAPYGYTWTADGKLADHPREQRAVATICSLRDDGRTIQEISEHLDESPRKYPPRGACWHPTTVYRILRRVQDG